MARVDAVLLRQPFHRCDCVVCVVAKRDCVDAAAALAGAAAVVAQDDITRFGERARELSEHGNAVDDLIPISGRSTADEHDPRVSEPTCHGRWRCDRSGQLEAVGGNHDVRVGRVARDLRTRRDARQVLAHDLQADVGQLEAYEPHAVVHHDHRVHRSARILQREIESPRGERAPRAGERLVRDGLHRGFDFRLRNDVERQLGAGLGVPEPRSQRLVRAEHVVGQDNGARADLIGFRARTSRLRDFIDRAREGERRRDADLRLAHARVEPHLLGRPVGRVLDLEPGDSEIERWPEAAAGRDDPARIGVRERDLFAPDLCTPHEHAERGVAGGWLRRLLSDRSARRGQTEGGRQGGTMKTGH